MLSLRLLFPRRRLVGLPVASQELCLHSPVPAGPVPAQEGLRRQLCPLMMWL